MRSKIVLRLFLFPDFPCLKRLSWWIKSWLVRVAIPKLPNFLGWWISKVYPDEVFLVWKNTPNHPPFRCRFLERSLLAQPSSKPTGLRGTFPIFIGKLRVFSYIFMVSPCIPHAKTLLQDFVLRDRLAHLYGLDSEEEEDEFSIWAVQKMLQFCWIHEKSEKVLGNYLRWVWTEDFDRLDRIHLERFILANFDRFWSWFWGWTWIQIGRTRKIEAKL